MCPSRHTTIRVIALCMSVALLASPAVTFGAPSASDPAAIRAQADAAKAKVGEMQSKVDATMSSYNAAADDLAKTRAQISRNEKEIARLEASIKAKREILRGRAGSMYRSGSTGFLEVLLESSSFDEFSSRLFVLSRIVNRDAALLQQLHAEKDQTDQLVAQLQQQEKQQASLVSDLDAKRVQAQSELNQQQAYVDSLSAQVAAALEAQTRAESKAKAAQHISAQPVSSSPPGNGGGGLVNATVEGLGGGWKVLSGEPTKYTATGVSFSGGATWYSTSEGGDSTASGRPLDDSELTCAHKSLPFGTRLAVEYNGRRVIVTVTDRGPYSAGNVIDLSVRAARAIGLYSAGTGDVDCTVVRAQ